jgi:hypothetical protein
MQASTKPSRTAELTINQEVLWFRLFGHFVNYESVHRNGLPRVQPRTRVKICSPAGIKSQRLPRNSQSGSSPYNRSGPSDPQWLCGENNSDQWKWGFLDIAHRNYPLSEASIRESLRGGSGFGSRQETKGNFFSWSSVPDR